MSSLDPLNTAGEQTPGAVFYSLPAAEPLPFWRRSAALTFVVGLHLVALLVLVGLAANPELARPLQTMTMRMLEIAPTPPKPEPPKPVKPPPPVPRKVSLAPPPIMTAAPSTVAAPSFVVAAQPEPRPVEIRPAPPAPPAIVAARFDADYLQNPKPVYPAMSRRLGEEGKVVLRVRVSAQGASLSVEIKQSSGFARLDEAARAAVEKWRFVPARQGSDAVDSSVLVPLNFTLDN
ncbi:MAG: energy transducer TonB [Rhodocyclaceae bacterium]